MHKSVLNVQNFYDSATLSIILATAKVVHLCTFYDHWKENKMRNLMVIKSAKVDAVNVFKIELKVATL